MLRADAHVCEAVPVARLPPEILILIFSVLSSIDRPGPTLESSGTKIGLGWLNVTYVCQRWRSIAVNEPTLWASAIALPSVLGDFWATESLSRAQDVPLTVTSCNACYPARSGPHPNAEFIGANLARTCAILDLQTYPHCLRVLCTPAPLLHTLGICIPKTRDPPPLPEGLFGGAAGLPELRHLSVTAYTAFSWTQLLLPQLVSINIKMHERTVPGAVLASLFAALGRMRALERLALQPKVTTKDISQVPITPLPVLRYLTLRTTVQQALLILERLRIPAGIRVRCIVEWGEYELPTLYPAMMTYLAPQAAAISHVDAKLVVVDRKLRRLQRYAEVGAWRNGDTDGVPALVVRFEDLGDVPPLLTSLASAHLEVLAVGGDLSDTTLFEAVKSAPRLRHLTVKGGAVPWLCTALERAPGIIPALSLLVVNLRTLEICLAKEILVDKLLACLAARARAGNVLEELEVVGFSEDEACVRALQEAVPGLVIRWRWTAKEGDYSEAVCGI
ncbi:hypothetical protein FA95DRAFT_1607578 [Auriscalpium vulgare]|uniref:Uncharacterized protein n=1 Tax=Auriscalpium vulgare TaxID=40419 RepID=A0ACB8RMY9_9AGAM|nr:hypothetical protein FA95DRAFT_1607578 [Auriscalpium vulgare]